MVATAKKNRMVKRMGLALAVCAVVPMLLFAFLAARNESSSSQIIAGQRFTRVSRLYAEIIRSRIGAAETIVQTLTARDIGYDGSSLRQEVSNSRAFKSVVLVDRNGLLAGGETTLRPGAAQLLALETGQTVLLPVTLQGQLVAVFLARTVSAAGVTRLAYFEIAPDWLWKDGGPSTHHVSMVVVDADGWILHNIGAL